MGRSVVRWRAAMLHCIYTVTSNVVTRNQPTPGKLAEGRAASKIRGSPDETKRQTQKLDNFIMAGLAWLGLCAWSDISVRSNSECFALACLMRRKTSVLLEVLYDKCATRFNDISALLEGACVQPSEEVQAHPDPRLDHSSNIQLSGTKRRQ